MVKEHNKSIQLTPHFNSNEFKCPCCGVSKTDDSLLDISERLHQYLGCSKLIITSGYRCNPYEMSLPGGVKNGYHTKGMAIDINVWKNAKERYSSKEIALALEDLGWKGGIGIISETAVHIDCRSTKYWFDERHQCKSIKTLKNCDSWYEYFDVKKKTSDMELAVDKLVKKGIITSGDYWKDKNGRAANIKQFNDNVDSLIIKFATSI